MTKNNNILINNMKYKKVRWELVPEIGEGVTLEKRNWFHNFHMNQWLHKRA